MTVIQTRAKTALSRRGRRAVRAATQPAADPVSAGAPVLAVAPEVLDDPAAGTRSHSGDWAACSAAPVVLAGRVVLAGQAVRVVLVGRAGWAAAGGLVAPVVQG